MAKTKGTAQLVFSIGGNLPDGTRVEMGDTVPADLPANVMRSLKANKMIDEAAEVEVEVESE